MQLTVLRRDDSLALASGTEEPGCRDAGEAQAASATSVCDVRRGHPLAPRARPGGDAGGDAAAQMTMSLL